MKAECTWGEGPDVLVSLDDTIVMLYEGPWNPIPPRGASKHGFVKNGSFDLTADEAEAFGAALISAAQQSRELDKSFAEHCKHMNSIHRPLGEEGDQS